MRLALVYHQFTPRGGLEGYLMEFAARLQSAGIDLDIVASEIAPEFSKRVQAPQHLLPTVKGSSLLRMWQFDRLAAQYVSTLRVDASIGFGRTTTHDLHRAGGGCHAIYSQLLPFWKRWGLKNQLELQLERDLYVGDRTKLFVVNSSQVSQQLHDVYGTSKDRFRVIHTAVDTERYRPAEHKKEIKVGICKRMQSDPERPVFLFVSLSHRRKGLDVLLDLWEHVDADLWIVGKPLDARYRTMIASRGLQSKVQLITAQSDVSMLYQAADWFIHPTKYDACANTVLQSMASGLPGLVSINDGAIDLMQDGENGFLLKTPGDPAEVLSVVQKALGTCAATYGKLSKAARGTVLPLTWESHLQQWLGVIEELAMLSSR